MSAAEIIEQIKSLPKEDIQVVARFIDEIRESGMAEESKPDEVSSGFGKAAGEIFEQYDDLFRALAK